MRAWTSPDVPAVEVPGPTVRVHDVSRGQVVATSPGAGGARLYVCGITPYDATHLGHAATYVAFDLLGRAWRGAGHAVRYVQNVTDVDDPLLERANETGQDWRRLAETETELFREDMAALRVLAPDVFLGATETVDLVTAMIGELADAGAVYAVDEDLYFRVEADPDFGAVSGWTREQMLAVFADRGGDPDRAGKKDPLDCLLWRAQRPGEPSWDSPYGPGRPGWHVECAAIAREHLGAAFDVQGGGSDLVFPHHEMSASEAQVANPGHRFAQAYVHAGMVALHGEKMSKSKGNLAFVSNLRGEGVDPAALRLALMRHHYRSDWEWTPAELRTATTDLEQLRAATRSPAGASTQGLAPSVLGSLAQDLDAPAGLAAVDEWAAATLAGADAEPGAGEHVRALVDAALGLAL